MIVVRVELWSAITGEKSEIARFGIWNVGSGSHTRGDYECASYTGRSKEAFDKSMISKRHTHEGKVTNHARLQEHVLNLVAKALTSMDYGVKNAK